MLLIYYRLLIYQSGLVQSQFFCPHWQKDARFVRLSKMEFDSGGIRLLIRLGSWLLTIHTHTHYLHSRAPDPSTKKQIKPVSVLSITVRILIHL